MVVHGSRDIQQIDALFLHGHGGIGADRRRHRLSAEVIGVQLVRIGGSRGNPVHVVVPCRIRGDARVELDILRPCRLRWFRVERTKWGMRLEGEVVGNELIHAHRICQRVAQAVAEGDVRYIYLPGVDHHSVQGRILGPVDHVLQPHGLVSDVRRGVDCGVVLYRRRGATSLWPAKTVNVRKIKPSISCLQSIEEVIVLRRPPRAHLNGWIDRLHRIANIQSPVPYRDPFDGVPIQPGIDVWEIPLVRCNFVAERPEPDAIGRRVAVRRS